MANLSRVLLTGSTTLVNVLSQRWADTGVHLATSMKNKERWMELCEKAAVEQDPERLLELVQEINRLLEEKEQRLKAQRQSKAQA